MKPKLSEGEIKETGWWCLHHKENTAYLSHMWRKYFEHCDKGDQERADQILKMMRAQLPAFEDVSRM
jgi:hypothetical protein